MGTMGIISSSWGSIIQGLQWGSVGGHPFSTVGPFRGSMEDFMVVMGGATLGVVQGARPPTPTMLKHWEVMMWNDVELFT